MGPAVELAHVQHDATLYRLGDRAVILPAHIGQHLADVLIDMQGGVVARIVGKQGDGVGTGGADRRGDAVTRLDSPLMGDLDHPLQRNTLACHHHSLTLAVGHGTVIVPLIDRLRAGHRGVLHRPGDGLLMGLIQAAGQRCRFGHLVPHGGGEAVPDRGKLIAPETGPGHAAQQQQQQETGAPEADHGVQIPPPEAATLVHSGPEDAAHPGPLAWPPEVEAAQQQYQPPACSQFDQPIPRGAEQQVGVQGAGYRLQIPLVVHGAEQGAAGGIHKQGQLLFTSIDDELSAQVGSGRRQVLTQAGIGHGHHRLGQQLVGTQGLAGGGDLHQLWVHQVVELGFEQIDDPGQ